MVGGSKCAQRFCIPSKAKDKAEIKNENEPCEYFETICEYSKFLIKYSICEEFLNLQLIEYFADFVNSPTQTIHRLRYYCESGNENPSAYY